LHVVSEDHSINRDARERVKYIGFTTAVGVLLLLNVTGLFSSIVGIDTAIFLTLLAGYGTFSRAIGELLEKRISADLAICIAAVAALSVGEYLAAAEAMFIMLVGEGLEAYAAGRTAAAIHKFVEQLPRRAHVLREGEEVELAVEELVPGDTIIVRAGERISADGVVGSGQSSVDESPITGESVPCDKAEGDEVYSGTLNGHGLLHIQVTHAAEDSTLARVVHLVEEAKTRRAPVVRQADRYAQYFLPALLLAAGATFYFTSDWLRTVAVLIVGCPCALILATPAAMVAGIGGLARRGILVRGGSILQLGSKIDTVVFDKTGTLTSGAFQIIDTLPADGFSEEQVLSYGASAESGSDHPLAKVIVETAQDRGIKFERSSEAEIVPGRGAECHVGGRRVRAGNEAFLAEFGVSGVDACLEAADRAGATAVLVAADGQLVGAILLRDTVRQGAHEAVHELEDLGIQNIILLTGDRKRAAQAVAREVGIPHVESELLPEQKLDRIRQLQAEGRKVAMIGDGVNDAPALAAADVGVAVAGSGADIAAAAADVVDLNRSFEKLPRLFVVSRRTVAIVWQNIIIFAGIVNVVAVLAASRGVLGPIGAAVVHQIASLLVMVNSVRLLKVERPKGRRFWLPRLVERTPIVEWWRDLKHWMSHLDPAAGFAWLWDRRSKLVKPVAITAAAAWVLSGVYTIQPGEVGVIERFGARISPDAQPGPHYKFPYPIDRVTRMEDLRVRTIEIGFRTLAATDEAVEEAAEPLAYEWNAQHRMGRFERKPDESLMLTGDQNMIEMTAVVHYRLERPDDFLFQQLDAETTLQVAAESVVQRIVNSTALDDLLTTERRQLEEDAQQRLSERLAAYQTGAVVLQVRFQDVHPSVEVVDAFREVAGALEEKSRRINAAEGYRNEQVALARGQAGARVSTAEGYSKGRSNRADGDASRFRQFEAGYRSSPGPNATRLYLEAMDEILPGRRKLVLDSRGSGRRTLYSIEDNVLVMPPGSIPQQPTIPFDDVSEQP
jgi:Cu+-exporting ATPase